MFDSTDYPKSLDEDQFEDWLEKGRSSNISYAYLMIVWNEYEAAYTPVYAENRNALQDIERYGEAVSHESLIAVYDLYSESKVNLNG